MVEVSSINDYVEETKHRLEYYPKSEVKRWLRKQVPNYGDMIINNFIKACVKGEKRYHNKISKKA